MASQIQIRRDSAANWTNTNPILAQGEFGLDLTNNYIKIGNGSSAWNDLPYFAANSVDISTVINYLSTNNVLISSLNIIDQLTATDIFGTGTEAIFSDTNNSTGFGQGTLTLDFTNGVYIPTSLTVVGNITGSNLNISNWNSVYTSYQSASGSFATNTAVNSVSSLLTPLTLTNTLTSQLVLNTDFDSYKTDVASATATLLPVTTYQSASGNWQDTFTNVQSNSANWNFGYDVGTFVQANSANWEESSEILPTVTNYLSSNTVSMSSITLNETAILKFGVPNNITLTRSGAALLNLNNASLAINYNGGTSTLRLADTTAGVGITIGGDTNLFRQTANTWRTGDNFIVDLNLGVGTLSPNEKLTVSGNISATGIVYAQGGNSTQWNQAYNVATTYQSASGAFVQTVTTTSPGISAVNKIVAVSAVPVVQEPGVLYIVV